MSPFVFEDGADAERRPGVEGGPHLPSGPDGPGADEEASPGAPGKRFPNGGQVGRRIVPIERDLEDSPACSGQLVDQIEQPLPRRDPAKDDHQPRFADRVRDRSAPSRLCVIHHPSIRIVEIDR